MQDRRPQRVQVSIALRLVPLVALTFACGGDDKPNSVARAEVKASAARNPIQTQPLESDPCAWVKPSEVEQLMGKLEGAPHTISQEGGTACVYTLPESGAEPGYTLPGMTPAPENLIIRIDFSDPLTYETASGIGAELMAQEPGYQAAVAAGGAPKEANRPEGWDYFGEGVSGAVFRQGHMAIVIGVFTPRHFSGEQQTAIATKLATLIRDRVPDLPVAAEDLQWEIGSGAPDPCSLITREEAEAVLGKLMLPPYRSQKTKPFVKDNGQACTYYRAKHRVLVITPHWSGGRELFQLASGLSEQFTSKTGVGEQSADTLEGPWDQAQADMDGTLNLLAGDRMLEVSYRTAGIEAGGALRLATLAVNRLKEAR